MHTRLKLLQLLGNLIKARFMWLYNFQSFCCVFFFFLTSHLISEQSIFFSLYFFRFTILIVVSHLTRHVNNYESIYCSIYPCVVGFVTVGCVEILPLKFSFFIFRVNTHARKWTGVWNPPFIRIKAKHCWFFQYVFSVSIGLAGFQYRKTNTGEKKNQLSF